MKAFFARVAALLAVVMIFSALFSIAHDVDIIVGVMMGLALVTVTSVISAFFAIIMMVSFILAMVAIAGVLVLMSVTDLAFSN